MELPANLLHLPPSELGAYRRAFPIQECGEPLCPLPDEFMRPAEHAYLSAGAPYGEISPFLLRRGVIERLYLAQAYLHSQEAGHRLYIVDCYRPIAVQRFMIDLTFNQLAHAEGLNPSTLNESDRVRLHAQVRSIWAEPSEDPKCPPPHSTGGALDLTILDQADRPLDMGSEIDAFPPECIPDHFAHANDPDSKLRHANRSLLLEVMQHAGFVRLPWEWWHFSYGDQWWGLLSAHAGHEITAARYGGV